MPIIVRVCNSRICRIAGKCLVILGIALLAIHPGFARDKYETIEAQAFGTGTQMGANIGVTLNIYEFSTPADRANLVQAFEKGQSQGLANALSKMKAVGHVEITGTLGTDCSYIRMTPTPTGPQNRLRHQSADPLWRSLFRHAIAVLQPHCGNHRNQRAGQEQEHGNPLSGGAVDP